MAWSPDGSRIASASLDGTVQVWEATTGTILLTYRGHAGPVWAAAWSPDGASIASGIGKAVEVWEVRTGQTRCIYQGHQDFLSSVAWSPDGQQVASGARDRTVQVWQP